MKKKKKRKKKKKKKKKKKIVLEGTDDPFLFLGKQRIHREREEAGKRKEG